MVNSRSFLNYICNINKILEENSKYEEYYSFFQTSVSVRAIFNVQRYEGRFKGVGDGLTWAPLPRPSVVSKEQSR